MDNLTSSGVADKEPDPEWIPSLHPKYLKSNSTAVDVNCANGKPFQKRCQRKRNHENSFSDVLKMTQDTTETNSAQNITDSEPTYYQNIEQLIMQIKRPDADLDVTSSNPCDMRQYDLFNFEEGSRQRTDDGLSNLPSYEGDHTLENLNLNKLPQIFFEEVQSSLKDWEDYMYCKEHQVLTRPVSSIEHLPDVRSYALIQYPEQNNVADGSFSCSKIEIRSHDDIWTDDTSDEQKKMKKLRADAEKIRGNHAYKAADYIKACEHYSNSISAIPLKDAYNNRAQANIKLENYSSALPDLNEVLKQDPHNVKALNRRALCSQHIRMYHEALCDLQSILDLNPKSKEALTMMAEVKKEMAALKGRKYRMRSIIERYKTFEVDVSQLPVYAAYEGNYILEVEKSGCAKSCVCSFCIAEDQCSRYRSNTLRIKERPRWQRLTPELLKELHVDFNATVTNTTATSASHSTSRNENSKNEFSKLVDSTGNGPKISIHQFYEKQLRDKNLVNAAYNSSKSTNANVISTTPNNVIALPAAGPTLSQTKFMKDSQNLSHQRAGSVENALQKLQLEDSVQQNGDVDDILKNCSPALLKKKFDSRLDDATLRKMINYVCMNFEPEGDWPIMSKYLKAIAELERFNIIISFVDSKTKNELMSLFSKAVNMKMEDASDLKSLFFAS